MAALVKHEFMENARSRGEFRRREVSRLGIEYTLGCRVVTQTETWLIRGHPTNSALVFSPFPLVVCPLLALQVYFAVINLNTDACLLVNGIQSCLETWKT